MRAIGIRAGTREITFGVFDIERPDTFEVDVIKVPQSLRTPEALRYIRSNLIDVMREWSIDAAGVRIAESNSQNLSQERISLEAIIQEASASGNAKTYKTFRLNQMAKVIGMPPADAKLCIDGKRLYDHPSWSDLSQSERECLICAMGAANGYR